jgi:tRNA pseudouridine38-40 synthase
MDMNGMARYQLILTYDGTLYEGFQKQARRNTVQGEVEKALRKIGWMDRSILSAGRTDTGVHASGQVIAFDLNWRHSVEDLVNALNANLPRDISARNAVETSPDFHPRFDAVSRQYRYRIYSQPQRDPFRDRFAWRIWPEMDISTLQAAAACIPGNRDFASVGTPPRPGGSTIRNVSLAEWQKADDEYVFTIEANAFLYHMVRRLVFLQVLAGSGAISVKQFEAGFTEGYLRFPGLADPCGLTFTRVSYSTSRQEDWCMK